MIVNIVIVAVLALIALGGIRTLIKNAHGESCCSGVSLPVLNFLKMPAKDFRF